jgi:acetyl-CoA carboxylase carboxyltransferase component
VELRESHSADPGAVYELLRSHARLAEKVQVAVLLLKAADQGGLELEAAWDADDEESAAAESVRAHRLAATFLPVLRALSAHMRGRQYREVAQLARHLSMSLFHGYDAKLLRELALHLENKTEAPTQAILERGGVRVWGRKRRERRQVRQNVEALAAAARLGPVGTAARTERQRQLNSHSPAVAAEVANVVGPVSSHALLRSLFSDPANAAAPPSPVASAGSAGGGGQRRSGSALAADGVSGSELQAAAVEAYMHRLYRSYTVGGVRDCSQALIAGCAAGGEAGFAPCALSFSFSSDVSAASAAAAAPAAPAAAAAAGVAPSRGSGMKRQTSELMLSSIPLQPPLGGRQSSEPMSIAGGNITPKAGDRQPGGAGDEDVMYIAADTVRSGVVAVFSSIDSLEASFSRLLAALLTQQSAVSTADVGGGSEGGSADGSAGRRAFANSFDASAGDCADGLDATDVLHLVLLAPRSAAVGGSDSAANSAWLTGRFVALKAQLEAAGVRRVTVAFGSLPSEKEASVPGLRIGTKALAMQYAEGFEALFTHRARLGFREDEMVRCHSHARARWCGARNHQHTLTTHTRSPPLSFLSLSLFLSLLLSRSPPPLLSLSPPVSLAQVRHMEAPLAFELELRRLSAFHVQVPASHLPALLPSCRSTRLCSTAAPALTAPQTLSLSLSLSLSSHATQVVPTQPRTHHVHLYRASPKAAAIQALGLRPAAAADPSVTAHRYHAIVMLNLSSSDAAASAADADATITDLREQLQIVLVESLDAVEQAMSDDQNRVMASGDVWAARNNHVFVDMRSLPRTLGAAQVEAAINALVQQNAAELQRLNVVRALFKCLVGEGTGAAASLRIIAANPTGLLPECHTYEEVWEPVSAFDANGFPATGGGGGSKPRLQRVLRFVGSGGGRRHADMDGREPTEPFHILEPHQLQRDAALQRSDTLYCYDFIELLRGALALEWAGFEMNAPGGGGDPSGEKPDRLLVKELALVPTGRKLRGAPAGGQRGPGGSWTLEDDEVELREVTRAPGQNDIGMVAWLVTMRTPEYPAGRQAVLLANDITHKAGSFGTREDELFLRASQLARELRCPRLYVAANSGARIGLSQDVKDVFNIAWHDAADPTRGYKYLYLTAEQHAALAESGAVQCERLVEPPAAGAAPGTAGEVRYVIKDVVGVAGADLGVENLRGSGMIAGETAKAYDDIFTLTFVAGRTVGIGAYLVRLGHRTIQKEEASPIILTGYQALNSLIGSAVYSSNNQIGGTRIMHTNGITHLVVPDHLEGVSAMLRWLSYVPATVGGPLPVRPLAGVDVLERAVAFEPKKGSPYDPRHLLSGVTIPRGTKVVVTKATSTAADSQSERRQRSNSVDLAGAGQGAGSMDLGGDGGGKHRANSLEVEGDLLAAIEAGTAEMALANANANEPPAPLSVPLLPLVHSIDTGGAAVAGEFGGEDSEWLSGFFDRGSFEETLAGWAKTVVVGRGRLGGIPMGVIVTENRTVEALHPADPADPSSQEKLTAQAGGVWFPDSAYKTASSMKDFNREGLPLIIFANWRGFSGGQRDMFDEVRKVARVRLRWRSWA